ncbi:MAG: hypothetical protein J0I54_02735 [Bosea sp.]|uniref:hypothetical protein n=1 Tax=unclassified Bosea (in: a-proteobacteria) TaxID=2653178 RepID=UPI001AC2739F|nr:MULTISPECIES: hypothetical protein [unclassified Bosea (in: a-proteobacteria)]MBN9455524.1 hypothetical protein [Bosea sp. (in: a-proteobacteria)]
MRNKIEHIILQYLETHRDIALSICAKRPDLGQPEPVHDKYFQQLVHLSRLGRGSPSGLVRAWRPHRRIRAGLRARPEMMSVIHPDLEKARLAAAVYAPAPEASALVYGLIGMALCSVGMWGAGLFYDLPLMPHLSLVVAG